MEAGDRFGDYVVLKRLASGGMAQVYLARRTGMAGFTKPLALKVILPQFATNPGFIRMFLDEARLAVCLNHSNIAQILDLGEVAGQYYIAMEFAHGEDLQQISRCTRKSGRLLPLPYAAKIISQATEGLYYAHTKTDDTGRPLNIVHRDISPHNILVTFDGNTKLIDFGIAKAAVSFRRENDEEGVLKGKYSYMSPEQIRGIPVDARADIFALGIVLWEISTGANLYREASELLTMEAILRKPVPMPRELRGDMPADLEQIILKALAKKPEDRFQNAFELHQALEDYLIRCSWNIGSPHLAEFMKRLFPEEYTEVHELLLREQEKVKAEEEVEAKAFVPWVPYAKEELDPARSKAHKVSVAVSKPAAPAGTPRSMLILLIVLLVLVCGIGVWILIRLSITPKTPTPPPNAAATAHGMLRIESNPLGSKVFINGTPRGHTPLVLTDLPMDEEFVMRLEQEGYEAYLAPVLLTASSPKKEFNVKMQRP